VAEEPLSTKVVTMAFVNFSIDTGPLEETSRSGMAEDIMFLIGLYEQLAPAARRVVMADSVRRMVRRWIVNSGSKDKCPGAVEQWVFAHIPIGSPARTMYGRLLAYLGPDGPKCDGIAIQDLTNLIHLYDVVDEKTELLTAAAEAFVHPRLNGLCNSEGDPLEASDWLALLASETRPPESDFDDLICTDPQGTRGARRDVFQDGELPVVLCSSKDVFGWADGLLGQYLDMRTRSDFRDAFADPAVHFHVKVDEGDFEEWQDDEGWVLNEEAWNQEVRRQCALEITADLYRWRTNFFDELLSGKPLRAMVPIQN